MSGNRAVVDDAPAAWALALHHRDRSLRAQERAGQVHIDDRLPLFVGQLVDRDGGSAGPGVVEQEIEPSEIPLDRGEQRLDGDGIADVAALRERAPSERLDFARHGGERLQAAARERDMPARLGERQGRRASDPPSGARDEREFVPGHFASQV